MNVNKEGEGSRYPITDRNTGDTKLDRVESRTEKHSEEDKVNGITMNVRNGSSGAAGLQIPLSQQTSATVCWERFLHVRTIRVLLVENDDCTRYIVTALLRNCSYEVVEASNGIQAWKVLEDLNNHIDIVLTEVIMPYLSGIGLLCKILNHRSRRNIPVIMMSSHDSMGLVFKCLSKGAVDFLVKPIRKNELKILWQHVWRRCQSSSGSGSESGTHQTQKSVKSKSIRKSDHDSGSSGENENGSIGLNASDGSSDGSGAQSSWTKKAVEVDSPRAVSLWDRVDSTCAQVVHSNLEVPSNQLVAAPADKETQEQDEKFEDVTMGRDLEISIRRNSDLELEPKDEPLSKTPGIMRRDNSFEKSSSKWKINVGKGPLDLSSESPSSKQMHEDGGSGFKAMSSHLQDNREPEAPNTHLKTLDTNEAAVKNSEELMHVEHSSKRHRGIKDDGTLVRDDRNVLRRSEGSAFSRYNPASNVNKLSGGNLGSNSLRDNSSQDLLKKTEAACDCHSNMNENESLPNNHRSHVGSNNFDMSSTTDNNAFTKPGAPKVSSAGSSSVKHSSFKPLPCDHHNQHASYNRVHVAERKLPPQCGSSNVYNETIEGNNNTVNYSVNGSVSGSGHGSNGPYGSSNGMNAGGMNMGSDNGAGKNGNGDGSGSGSGSGSGNVADENKISQREAALTKFRQKRKERCFRKKVRYQSRKKLAEQRPRVRGQFVRKTAAAADDSDIKDIEDS
ncbi:PREDICTED: two-component response regulator-like APRR7 isoform X1 [Camelina sativa]|uniref:Two-component response regulator-like APRR7 isoform X1 n=1 Tax=Camelina sativa TaxID=90675 RepID=A0ABM0XTA8_CAMSA|nr:PREDICTED: two-component response regulator-like APRR7 isoform X1 [Camelina sativa]